MPLIKMEHIHMAYGHVALLDDVALLLEAGERLCLLGRNGEGKSTLLKILGGELQPDTGVIERSNVLRVARLTQEVVSDAGLTVFQAVAAGLGNIGEWVARYHELSHALNETADEKALAQLEQVQHQLEAADGWRLEQRVETVLSRLDLPAESKLAELSGGWKRRVELARALVQEPDVLLLDEPTNHLDIEAIQWLEDFLRSFQGGLVFVSHDRAFVQALATRIIALDRGCLRSYPGDYQSYLRRRDAELEAEAQQTAKADKLLAQEEVWIRQGIKARRTRDQGRVRALQKMREDFAARRSQQGKIKFNLEQAERSGKLVIEAENLYKSYQGKTLVGDFSCTVLRGDRIGLLGPNGIGKTTLLKLLLGELEPDSGTVKHGTKLQVAYFDQLRARLDPEQAVFDCVSEGRDSVTINGKTKHVMSYLADFLFPPQRARSPIKSLSGGERNRLLLARLFTKPANVLVLDEPTNDLDIESLELLEDLLLDYDGTLLLVSHDRAFLDNAVTSVIAFEGCGKISQYAGGYQDWLRQSSPAPQQVMTPKHSSLKMPPVKKRTKLSYKDQRELERLPQQIEAIEKEQNALQKKINDPLFYRGDTEEVNRVMRRLTELEEQLTIAYKRWEALEDGNT